MSVRRYKLSHFLRSISERAFGRRDNSFFPIYEVKDFEEVLNSRDPSVREKQMMLLRYIASLSSYPGHTIGLQPLMITPYFAQRIAPRPISTFKHSRMME